MGLKSRNNGTLEKWNNGKKENYKKEDLPNIPVFQHSIIYSTIPIFRFI